MSYQIQYEAEKSKQYPARIKKTHRRKTARTAMAILVLMALFCMSQIRSWFIPGDKDVTKAAFSKLVEDIQNGESFSKAVDAFGKEIVRNGY